MKYFKNYLIVISLIITSKLFSQIVTTEELDILNAYKFSDNVYANNMPELHDNDLNTYATWRVGDPNNTDWGIIELYYSFFVITEIQLLPRGLGTPHSWDFNIYIKEQFQSGDGTLVYTNSQYLQSQVWITIPVNDVPGYQLLFKESENTPAIGTDLAFYEIKVFGRSKIAQINAKILLEGPYNNGNMGEPRLYIPTGQPFYHTFGYTNGTEIIQASNKSTFITNNNIIEWVLLELWRGSSPEFASLYSRRAALLKNDGTIIDIDGSSSVEMKVAGTSSSNFYYLVIKQQNHLPIMSSERFNLPGN
ncbi:MAG: hypothetical protein KDC52_02825 [Ignavibacteriae bacterium]|nr:hypothetical protein [Ignavibacteriota bacterium]MCB9208090.1 hypothetical protein [Ignavibacteriales bacterium]MCB9258856.1 hypothetical protein [Ignavibacteriales bacterium]